METGKSSGGGFVVVFLLFGTCVAITILMLLTALVVWLSEVMGSFIAATLILSGLFAAASRIRPRQVLRHASAKPVPQVFCPERERLNPFSCLHTLPL